MRRLAAVILLIIGSAALTAAPLAFAQEYAQETGDLELTRPKVLTLSGDGFVADSVVFLTLTATGTDQVIDLGTLETDSTGAFSGSITLPDDLEPGMYTLSATGVTEDGATRVLSAEASLGGDVTTGSTTTTTAAADTTTSATTTTTRVLGAEASLGGDVTTGSTTTTTAAADTTTSATTIIFVGLLIYLIPVVISFMKGKPGFGIAGIPSWTFAWVGAIRIAKPHSWWARRNYPLGGLKMQTAIQRFESAGPATPQPPTGAAQPPAWWPTLRDLMRRSPFASRRDR